MVMCELNINKVTTTKKNVIWEYLNLCVCINTHILAHCTIDENYLVMKKSRKNECTWLFSR